MFLNLTQRQFCEDIARMFSKQRSQTERWLTFLTRLVGEGELSTFEGLTEDLKDLGIINQSLGFNEFMVFDDAIEQQIASVKPITMKFINTYYDQEFDYSNLMDTARRLGYNTLTDWLGSPWMEAVRSNGSATIVNYAKRHFPYNAAYAKGILILVHNGIEIPLSKLTVYQQSGQFIAENLFENAQFDSIYELLQCIAMCSQTNGLLYSIAAALSGNVCSPSDLFAVASKYVNSPWGSIRSFANRIITAGSNSIQLALANFISMFRSMQDFSISDEGILTWNTPGTHVNNSAWMVASQIGAALVQTLGYILIMVPVVALKVVGGVLIVASSIGQAFANTIGQITGTTPYINDDAIDDVYADPIFSGHESIPRAWFHTAYETIDALAEDGRAKIVLPWCIIYLYNYDVSDTDSENIEVDYKIFARMQRRGPSYVSSERKLSGIWTLNNGGLISIHSCASSDMSKDLSMIADDMRELPVSNLEGNSPNADQWISFYRTLCYNAGVTLYMVLSNPFFFFNDGDKLNDFDMDFDNRFYKYVEYIYRVNYAEGNAAISSSDIVNAITAILNFDYGVHNTLFCALLSCGVLQVPDAINYPHINQNVRFYYSYNDHEDVLASSLAVRGNGSLTCCRWLDEDYSSLPFVSIDKQCYATPHNHSFKSVLWGAIICATAIAVVTTGFIIGKAVVSRKFAPYWTRKGMDLNSEGSFYRESMNSSQWAHLAPEEQDAITRNYRRYMLKVRMYNAVSGLLGMSTLDWQNGWFNQPTATAVPLPSATDTGVTVGELATSTAGQTAIIAGMDELGVDVERYVSAAETNINTNVSEVKTNTDTLFTVITGNQPQ